MTSIAKAAPALPKAIGKSAPRAQKVFVNVQGLRAVAAILVFGIHLNVIERRFTGSAFLDGFSPLGDWGVDLFFVISGFVMITSSWNDFATPGVSLRFLLRRISRIYPPYWVILVPILLLYLRVPEMVNASQTIKPNIAASFLLLPQAGFGLLIVGWTLVYEMFFYVVFAVVLTAKRQYCLPLVALWAVLTLVICVLTRHLNNLYLATYTDPLLLEFIFGVAIGYLIKVRGVPFVIPSLVIGIAGLLVSNHYFLSIDTAYSLHGGLRFAMIGIPAVLIFAGVVGLETRYGLVVPGWIQIIGNASYSLYLWHITLTVLVGRLSGARSLLERPWVHAAWLLIVALFVVGSSVGLYYLIELPMLRFFSKLFRRPVAALPERSNAVR
jgi:exopolysaccharide production protein ExoZ